MSVLSYQVCSFLHSVVLVVNISFYLENLLVSAV